MTLGGFVSPYVVTAIQSTLGTMEIMPIYPVLAVVIVAATVLSLVLAVLAKKRGEVYGASEAPVE